MKRCVCYCLAFLILTLDTVAAAPDWSPMNARARAGSQRSSGGKKIVQRSGKKRRSPGKKRRSKKRRRYAYRKRRAYRKSSVAARNAARRARAKNNVAAAPPRTPIQRPKGTAQRPVTPSGWRGAVKRTTARTISDAEVPFETFPSLSSLLRSLPDDGEIRVRYGIYPGPGVYAHPVRFDKERRNVQVVCWLHGIRRDTASDREERDIELLIGSTQDTATAVFMVAEIPAPWEGETAQSTFEPVRRQLAGVIGGDTLSADPASFEARKVVVSGAIFFDGRRDAGKRYDPGRDRTRPLTVWEIHPVTSIKLFTDGEVTGNN